MKIEKIKINGHYVWVDKDAEIKEGDYYYVDNSLGKRIENILPYPSGFVAKIIAASPELKLEGVSTYFIKGYQTAEKELPTWDDVRKAIEMAREQYPVPYTNGDYEFEYSEEEIIEQIKRKDI